MNDTDVLRDITNAWHLCVLAGLTTPAAATATEATAAVLAATALTHGQARPAATLAATALASLLASSLIH